MEATARTGSAWTLGSRLLVVAGAVAVGLLLQQLLSERLAAILERAQTDRIGARAELAGLVRWGSTLVFGLTGALGLTILLACRNAGAALRFPPPGVLSMGTRRAITGPLARRMTRVGYWLGLLLVVISVACLAFAWYLGAILVACRA